MSRKSWCIEYYSTSGTYWSKFSRYGWTLSPDDDLDTRLFTLPEAMFEVTRWKEDDKAYAHGRVFVYRIRNVQTGQTIII